MKIVLKMPERLPLDGPVSVRNEHSTIVVEVKTDHTTETIHMSEYNAWRVFGMLSLMLRIPLPPATGKAIKL